MHSHGLIADLYVIMWGSEMGYYWVPKHKYQLVEWLSEYFGGNRKEFRSKSKGQLYAIYHKVRQKGVVKDGTNLGGSRE